MRARASAALTAGLLAWTACAGEVGTTPPEERRPPPAKGPSGDPSASPTPSPTPASPPTATPAAPASLMDVLRGLAPNPLPPPPPDPTNRYADDPKAIALGHRFFYDKRFSGPLLDEDHKDGTEGALGNRGETGKVACASCHNPEAGFVDVRSPRQQLSLGAAWSQRRARSLLDVGQARLLMWDGRHDAHWNQIFSPIEKHFELNSGRLFVAQQLARDAKYRQMYRDVFAEDLAALADPRQYPQLARGGCTGVDAATYKGTGCHGLPGDKAEYDGLAPDKKDLVTRAVVNLGKAVEAFERQLRCGPGRFDAWIRGDAAALTASEQRGALLFAGKGQCARCHAGPFLTDQRFYRVGLRPGGFSEEFLLKDDPGALAGLATLLTDPLNTQSRYSDAADGRLPPAPIPSTMKGKFRTPALRCVANRPSYMHTGQYRSLEDVVSFFNRGGHKDGYPGESEGGSEIMPLGLTLEEEEDLVAFLQALDGLAGKGTPSQFLKAPID